MSRCRLLLNTRIKSATLLLFFPAFLFMHDLAIAGTDCTDFSLEIAKQKLDVLRKEIRFHDRLYYVEMRPVISDAEYDRLFSELLRLETCFPSLTTLDSPTRTVGAPADDREKQIAHEQPMLGISSSSTPKVVERLLAETFRLAEQSVFVVQPKVDGLPVELIYRKGILVSAATRGDGEMGEAVTAMVRGISTLPLNLRGNYANRVVVRGEVYADRERFDILNRVRMADGLEPYATVRHLAAAALRSQSPEPGILAVLGFFPFELVNADEIEGGPEFDWQALQLLASWGFPVQQEHVHQAKRAADIQTLYRNYLAKRSEYPFAMDGIVVKVDRLALRKQMGLGNKSPKWAAAWKFPPATARTSVEEITWSTGRTGRRTPIAHVAPIEIRGVRISRVSLHNAAQLARLGVVAGDEVIVALAGDVIPQIIDVVGKAPLQLQTGETMPELVPPPIDACLTDSPECRDQFTARAAYFVSKSGLDIAGLGRKRLEQLVAAGLVVDLPSIFQLRAEDMGTVPGFGEKRSEKIAQAIQQSRRPPLSNLVTAIGIPGVGRYASKKLAQHFETMDELIAAGKERLATIPGIGPETADAIRAFFGSPGGRNLLERLEDIEVF
jgi:DNA ligase (NAD+)